MHPRPSPRPLAFLALLGALVASGCGEAPAPQRASRSDAIGEDVPQACVSTDAHARHASASVACVACHPCGGSFGFDAAVTYPGGTTSAGGTFTAGTATSAPSCSVGCHSPLGSPAHTVAWDAPGPLACTGCHDVTTLLARTPTHPVVSADATREFCQGCHTMTAHTSGTVAIAGHDAAWVDRTSSTFHAFSANQGLNRCQGCHLPDLSGGATGVSCASCHDGTQAVAWGCTMCHGGIVNATGAPPKATWGNAGDPDRGGGVADPIRVGAHTAHVTPSEISPGFGCAVCHVTPADAVAPGHVDDETVAQVVFAGIAVGRDVAAPTWDRESATCSSTYCHGATMTGSAPAWTAGEGAAACGTCHGVPPPAPHPSVDTSAGLGRCSTCHPLTIDTTGTVIPPSEGGSHLNGTLEAMGHDQQWMDTTSTEFHAYAVDRNLSGCTGCHGAQLDGGATGISCASCHDGTQAVAWSCVMCHGGTDSQTGAPPKALWGYAGDPDRGGGIADPLRVGAHTKHLGTTLMSPIECGTCHVVPEDALSPGHIDGSDALATLTWSGRAVTGGAQPQWSRETGTCASTYCHGNYSGTYVYGVWDWSTDSVETRYAPYSGGKAAPGWADATVTCGSCHGNPPAQTGWWHSGQHGSLDYQRQCQLCHPDAYSETGTGLSITDPTQHVNGIVEVTPGWSSQCFGCH
jgi:predicted CxxxxCH...CXXCH cytochrome family protein